MRVKMLKSTYHGRLNKSLSVDDEETVDDVTARRWVSNGIAEEVVTKVKRVKRTPPVRKVKALGRETEARREEGRQVETELEAVGFAAEQTGVEEKAQGSADDSAVNYEELGYQELRAVAKKKGISSWGKSKAQLIEELGDND